MTSVCYALVYVFESLISLMFFGNKFSQKFKSGFIFLSFMISATIQFGINYVGIPYVNLAAFIIFNFLLCFLCYETKVTQAVFNSLLLAATMLITELVTVYVSRFAFGIDVTEHTSNDMLLLIQSGTAKLLYFLTAYLISKFATKESRSDLKNTKSALLLLLPIASIIVLLGIVRITELYATTNAIYILFSVATILLMYANITVFWVHESLIKTQKEKHIIVAQIVVQPFAVKSVKRIFQTEKRPRFRLSESSFADGAYQIFLDYFLISTAESFVSRELFKLLDIFLILLSYPFQEKLVVVFICHRISFLSFN